MLVISVLIIIRLRLLIVFNLVDFVVGNLFLMINDPFFVSRHLAFSDVSGIFKHQYTVTLSN